MHQLSTLTPEAGTNSVWHSWVTAGIHLYCLRMSCGVCTQKDRVGLISNLRLCPSWKKICFVTGWRICSDTLQGIQPGVEGGLHTSPRTRIEARVQAQKNTAQSTEVLHIYRISNKQNLRSVKSKYSWVLIPEKRVTAWKADLSSSHQCQSRRSHIA